MLTMMPAPVFVQTIYNTICDVAAAAAATVCVSHLLNHITCKRVSRIAVVIAAAWCKVQRHGQHSGGLRGHNSSNSTNTWCSVAPAGTVKNILTSQGTAHWCAVSRR